MSEARTRKSYHVWDLPTRAFHWLLFASVAVAYLTSGEEEGGLFQLHVGAGYLIAALLIFRVIWGFVGSERARFADFLPTPGRLREHVAGLLQGRPKHYAGHNPLGGLAVVAIIAILVATLATGLLGLGEDLHETFGNLILIVAGVHVAGVLLESALTGENLVSAMVTGRKRLPDDAEGARDSRPAGARRALATLAVVAVAGSAGVASGLTPWPPTEAAFEGAEHEAEHDGSDYGAAYEDNDEDDYDYEYEDADDD